MLTEQPVEYEVRVEIPERLETYVVDVVGTPEHAPYILGQVVEKEVLKIKDLKQDLSFRIDIVQSRRKVVSE
jgi:hypothetical protein